jgi:site-specific recombinase XerD
MKNLDLLETQKAFIEALAHSGKSFNTLKNYKTDLNIFNKFLLLKERNLILNELTNAEVQEYNQYLEDKYNSPNSIRRRVQALRMYFDFLIGQKLVDENPIKRMSVAPKVVDLPNPFPFHMVKNLVGHLESCISKSSGHGALLYHRNLVLTHLIYGAGLKVSDVERLYFSHINLTDGIYRVLVAPDKRDPFTVSFASSFNPIYEGYTKLLESQKRKDKIEFENLLFNGNPFKILKGGLSARGMEVIFKELTKNLKHQVTAKNLRQACVFKWISQGLPDSRVKEWMGVQPKYSLAPYKNLLKENPQDFTFMELV